MLIQPPSTARYGAPLISCDDRYADRAVAGRHLAELLQRYRGSHAMVLALPSGGIAVAGELAHALRLPLDVLVARAFVVRQYPTLAAGALSEGGGLCFNAAVLRLPGVVPDALWREARSTWRELAPLVMRYRHGRALPPLLRRPVILVDDGLGDGLVQLAALAGLRHYHPQSVTLATPSATPAVMQVIARHVATIVALATIPDAHQEARSSWRHMLGDDAAAILLDGYRYDNATVHPATSISICSATG